MARRVKLHIVFQLLQSLSILFGRDIVIKKMPTPIIAPVSLVADNPIS